MGEDIRHARAGKDKDYKKHGQELCKGKGELNQSDLVCLIVTQHAIGELLVNT